MKKIEEMNFTRLVYRFLKLNNVNTLEDIKKIDYYLINNEKDIYNALASRIHSENMMFDFEVPFYNIMKRRLVVGESIKISELLMSSHTKTALKKINVNYLDELSYLDMNTLKLLRNNEFGEVMFFVNFFNISLSDKRDSILDILNLDLDEVILSDNAIFELKALGCMCVSDFVHQKRNSVLLYLDDEVIVEVDNKMKELFNGDLIPLEISLKQEEQESVILQNEKDKKEKCLKLLERLHEKNVSLISEIEDMDKKIKTLSRIK